MKSIIHSEIDLMGLIQQMGFLPIVATRTPGPKKAASRKPSC